jgi:hypothetical protein
MKRIAYALLITVALLPFGATAQGISQLQQFTATTSPAAITQSVFGKAFRLTGQSSGCAQFSANGTLTSTGASCGTGSGGSGFSTTSTDYWLTQQNTGSLTEGSNLYWTLARGLSSFISNLAATTSVKSITTLPGLSLPYSQLTGTPTIPTKTSDLTNDSGFSTFSYLFPSNATTTNITFSGGLTGNVTGNADTVTNGVYTTTFNSFFDPRFVTDLAATSSVKSITTLPSLSLPDSQLTGTPSTFSYPFPSNATSTSIAFNGGLTASTLSVGTLTGLLKAASGAVSAASNGTDYTLVSAQSCTNQVVTALTASGGSTCSTISNAMLANSTISGITLGGTLATLTATNSTLTFSGSYTGATARTIGLNLANANTWTGLQQFSSASSTQFSAASQTFYIDGTGKVKAKDTVSGYSGTLSPLHNLAISMATTTAWTGTTTGAYSATVVLPFAGTLEDMRCKTDAGTLEVQTKLNSTVLTYFNISSTQGLNTFSSSNTFAAGDVLTVNAGNPATSPTMLSCTYRAAQS